jgi:phosphoglycerol transferase MdoB-like AlkP superfamily enzyme
MIEDISFLRIVRFAGRVFLLNAAVLFMMSAFRLVFCLYYGNLAYLSSHTAYVVKAFFMGARYDLAVVAYINGLVSGTFTLVWLVRSESLFRRWQKLVRWYYFLTFSALFIILCIDFGFFSYFKNHLNILIFGLIEDNTRAVLLTLSTNYNLYLAGAGFAVLVGFIFFIVFRIMRLKGPQQLADAYQIIAHANARVSGWGKTGIIVALLSFNFLAARGSFGMFPLGVADAEISPDLFINKLCLNGVFTLQEAVEARTKASNDYDVTDLTGYKGNMPRAFADFLGKDAAALDAALPRNLIRYTKLNPLLARNKPNVIVIMMEGFGTDLIHYNSPTFNIMGELKSHFDDDTVFENFLSGDVGTIGSLETVMTSLPMRALSKPITQSRYAFKDYPFGAAIPYHRAGYDRMGFYETAGSGAMPSSYERNQWGVYDEYLFDFVFHKLSDTSSGKSKFIFALSTSNHPPYSLPSNYKPLPLSVPPQLQKLVTGDAKLAQGRFATYQYACQKLGEFLTRLKKSEYAGNTIVAVTGDHNFWNVFDYGRERYLDMDSVPFYIYIPPSINHRGIDPGAFGSHIDIMPTLYNLSLSSAQYMAVGRDLLDASQTHVAYNGDGLVMNDKGAVRHSLENNADQCFVWHSTDSRRLVESPCTAVHAGLVRYYKAAVSIADYLIKETGK